MGVPLYNICCFFPPAFEILSLSLITVIFITLVCMFPPSLLFGQRHLSFGTYRLLGGPSLGAKMSASRRAHAGEWSPIYLPPVSVSPG